MGRHSAADGESSHPLVVAALAGRAGDGDGAHRGDVRAAGEEGEVGWPGPPAREGGGLGWPGGDQTQTQDRAAAAPPRRGWRRLFGAAPAA
ncbi:hypothetical protein [Blastococcus capsensis]|uniref:hypothetical protein n=1 Tax=Blastococcus capsensis TaxID=1564163 RepID=UPI0025409E80|nr:hypothetical protein [Blastococcus capsensis]MDK3255707.1 hypothetical protein [Blastococcus capsensis]